MEPMISTTQEEGEWEAEDEASWHKGDIEEEDG